MTVVRWLVAWFAALLVLLLRLTCRVRAHDDPRPRFRQLSYRYAYAVLHGHQLACVLASERGTAAMVSRSADGDLLVPSLLVNGVVPVRGSTRKHGVDKGGSAALMTLVGRVRTGLPAFLAVDGPRGPRGYVNRGIARLCVDTGAVALLTAPIPRRRWVLSRAWDRFQIPQPFTTIDLHFHAVHPQPEDDVESLRLRIEAALADLEMRVDPQEAVVARRSASLAAATR